MRKYSRAITLIREDNTAFGSKVELVDNVRLPPAVQVRNGDDSIDLFVQRHNEYGDSTLYYAVPFVQLGTRLT